MANHSIDTTFQLGWSRLGNGELLDEAEQRGYELLITTDQQMRHQQNLHGRRLAILVLLSTAWPAIQRRVSEIRTIVNEIGPGDYREFTI